MAPQKKDSVEKGVLAGMVATVLVHPLDVIKVRKQISTTHNSALQVAWQLFRYEGLPTFYCGLTAGLLRQATYTATRLTMYNELTNRYFCTNNKCPHGYDKIFIGIYAGLCGGMAGNPSEVVLVRRMAEGCRCLPRKCGCCRGYGYTGTVDAFRKIISTEGFLGLWRGATLTLLRSVVISIVHVGFYSQIRDFVKEKTQEKDPFTLTLYTAVGMSFVTAIVTHPIDLIKTFFQISRPKKSQQEIIQHVTRCKGVCGLWKGFTPYFIRMAVHTMVTFMVLENMKNM